MLALLVLLTCVAPPVDAAVIDPYRPPACPWCAGNRGITYGTEPRTPVRAVLPGIVSFSGRVVDVAYVVVAVGDGRRLTYGGLERADVPVGARVSVGETLGVSSTTVHFGVRRGSSYEDPMGVLTGRTRARLVRLDGRRRPPSASIPCGPATAGSS